MAASKKKLSPYMFVCVDVEVDWGADHGEQVGEGGGELHPQRPYTRLNRHIKQQVEREVVSEHHPQLCIHL